MRQKEIKKEEIKKFIVHKEQKFRSNENSKDRKIIRVINKAVSTAQLKNRHIRWEDD